MCDKDYKKISLTQGFMAVKYGCLPLRWSPQVSLLFFGDHSHRVYSSSDHLTQKHFIPILTVKQHAINEREELILLINLFITKNSTLNWHWKKPVFGLNSMEYNVLVFVRWILRWFGPTQQVACLPCVSKSEVSHQHKQMNVSNFANYFFWRKCIQIDT